MRTSMIGRVLQKVGGMLSRRGRTTTTRRRTPAGVGARGTPRRRGGGGITSMVRRFLR